MLGALSTLIAAFAGTWFAFRLQFIRSRQAEEKTNITAGNRALATLLLQFNTLKIIQVDSINPVRSNRGRHIEIQPCLHLQEDSLQFDMHSLSFLLEPNVGNIFFELSIQELRYREALKAINVRSKLHLEVIQPLMAKAGLKDRESYSEKEFLQATGEFHYQSLKSLTDDVVRYVDETVETLSQTMRTLRKRLVELYPKGNFIEVPQQSIGVPVKRG